MKIPAVGGGRGGGVGGAVVAAGGWVGDGDANIAVGGDVVV